MVLFLLGSSCRVFWPWSLLVLLPLLLIQVRLRACSAINEHDTRRGTRQIEEYPLFPGPPPFLGRHLGGDRPTLDKGPICGGANNNNNNNNGDRSPWLKEYFQDFLDRQFTFRFLGLDALIRDWHLYRLLLDPKNATWATHNNSQESFGRNGEFTQEVLQQQDQLLEFWQLNDNDSSFTCLLFGLHSEPLQDRAILEQAVVGYYVATLEDTSYTKAQIQNRATNIHDFVSNALVDNYSNPILTAQGAALVMRDDDDDS